MGLSLIVPCVTARPAAYEPGRHSCLFCPGTRTRRDITTRRDATRLHGIITTTTIGLIIPRPRRISSARVRHPIRVISRIRRAIPKKKRKRKSTYTNGAGLVAEAGVAQNGSIAAVEARDEFTGGYHLLGNGAVIVVRLFICIQMKKVNLSRLVLIPP